MLRGQQGFRTSPFVTSGLCYRVGAMKCSLRQIAEAVDARLHGDGSVEVEGVASIGSASRHDLVFVEEEKYLLRALECGAGAVIAGEFAAGKLASGSSAAGSSADRPPRDLVGNRCSSAVILSWRLRGRRAFCGRGIAPGLQLGCARLLLCILRFALARAWWWRNAP